MATTEEVIAVLKSPQGVEALMQVLLGQLLPEGGDERLKEAVARAVIQTAKQVRPARTIDEIIKDLGEPELVDDLDEP